MDNSDIIHIRGHKPDFNSWGNGLIVTGDVHLKRNIWSSRTEIEGDTYTAFRAIVQECLDLKCHLVLCGDVFDSQYPTADDVQEYLWAYTSLNKAGLQMLATYGNHDKPLEGEGRTSWVELLEYLPQFDNPLLGTVSKGLMGGLSAIATGFHYVSPEMQQQPGVWDITGRGWSTGIHHVDEHKEIPVPTIMFGHQTPDLVQQFNPMIPANMRYADIADIYNFAFLGDYHVPYDFVSSVAGKCHVFTVGSPVRLGWGENHRPRILRVYSNAEGRVEIESIPMLSRQRLDISLDGRQANSPEEAARMIKEQLDIDLQKNREMYEASMQPLVRLSFYPAECAPNFMRNLSAILTEQNVFVFTRPLVQDQPEAAELARGVRAAMGTEVTEWKPVLGGYLDPKEDPQAFELTSQVVETVLDGHPEAVEGIIAGKISVEQKIGTQP